MIKSIFAYIFLLVGSIANLFVVISMLIQIKLERSLQPANILVTFNSLTNLVIGLLVSVMYQFLMTVCPNIDGMPALFFLWELFSGIQIWSIALICVFYCLKIIPEWGTTFLVLKRNFSSVVVTILLVGLTLTLVSSVIDIYRVPLFNGTLQLHNRSCPYVKLPDRLIPAKYTITFLMYTSVLTLVISSCWAVVAHLSSHMRRMRENQSEVGGAKLEGVARVALMIFLLGVEFVVCTAALHILLVQSDTKITRRVIQNSNLIALMLSLLIPITLITGISTLRKRATTCFSGALQHV